MALVAALGLTMLQIGNPPTAQATDNVCATPPMVSAGEFVTCWDTTLTASGTSPANTIALPVVGSATYSAGTYNFTVNWGDGSSGTVTSWDDPDATHIYADPGRYWVTISGQFDGFSFGRRAFNSQTSDAPKLIDVRQWGSLKLGNAALYFWGASNMNFSATDAPDLSATTNLEEAFAGATSLNSDLSGWNTITVQYMNGAFQQATNFDNAGAALTWDTRNVVNMSNMFNSAAAFNSDISSWDTSNVSYMTFMFNSATAFDRDISDWDTSAVQNFQQMFFGASSFNNGGEPLTWDVSSASNLVNMFAGARGFNQSLPDWSPGTGRGDDITSTVGMFDDIPDFNQNLSSWNISAIDNALHMLRGTGLSTANYNSLLTSWGAVGSGAQSNVSLGEIGSSGSYTAYSSAGITGRAALIASGWTITDGGLAAGSATAPTFTSTTLGTTTDATLTVSNTGDAALTLGSPLVTVSGADASSFSIVEGGTCAPGQLAAGTTCTVTIRFDPQGSGTLATTATVNVTGDRAMPAAITAALSGVGTLAAPTGLTATRGDESLSISFTAPSDGGSAITNYQYSVDGGGWVVLSPADAASPVTIPSLTNGTEVDVRLRAVNAAGTGAISESVTGTPSTVAGAPRSVSATAGDESATVTWLAPLSNGGAAITNYQYSVDNGATWAAFSPAVTYGPATIPTLVNGTSYQVRLRAINAAGEGAASSADSVTPRTLASAPRDVTVTTGNERATIDWTTPSSDGGAAITNYQYSLNNGSTWTAFSPSTTAGPETILDLDNGTTYQFRLRAVTAAGNGAASEAVTGTPSTVPGAPRSVAASPGNGSAILTWAAPASNGGAAITSIEYSLDGGPWTAFSPPTTSGPATINGLQNGTTYQVRLRAVNLRGEGAASAADSVRPAAPAPPPSPVIVTPTPSPTPTPTPSISAEPSAAPTPTTPLPDAFTDPTQVTPAELANLAPGQLLQLTPVQLQQLPASTLGSLTPQQVAVLTSEQVSALRPAQAASIPPASVAAMSPRQFAALQPAALGRLSAAAITRVTVQQVSELTPTQLFALRPTQIRAMSPKVLASLSEVQVASLRPTALASIPLSVLSQMTAESTRLLRASQLSSLSAAQLRQLTPDALRGLRPQVLGSLPASWFERLTPEQRQTLTPVQRRSLART